MPRARRWTSGIIRTATCLETRVGFSQVLPFNTVSFGGYLIHEVYNAHNFLQSRRWRQRVSEIVGIGAKFRSGYFQQDDVTFFVQDDFIPIPQIHIIPGVRVDGFSTSYSDQARVTSIRPKH